MYLQHTLPIEIVHEQKPATQAEAWSAFVAGMTALVAANVPPGHIADDSRETMYGDGN